MTIADELRYDRRGEYHYSTGTPKTTYLTQILLICSLFSYYSISSSPWELKSEFNDAGTVTNKLIDSENYGIHFNMSFWTVNNKYHSLKKKGLSIKV